MWIANLFARDLYQWDSFTDHHDLVRGYILEKYFTETNPKHKLAEMRSYGGLAGAEYEAAAAPRFFERYLALPAYDDARHYLLAYELQRRYYVRDRPLAAELSTKVPGAATDPVDALAGLADIMTRTRRAVAAQKSSQADARRLVDIAITSAALIQGRGSAWLEVKGQTARQHLRVLAALIEAAYGSGLLAERERAETARTLDPLTSASSLAQADLAAG